MLLNKLILLIPYIALVSAVAYFGRDRKFGFWGNFAASFLMTPLFGIVVLFAQDKKAVAA
ncbi:MAG: hypothetical protein MK080_07445 [Opitutales bacterium]|nr:hypothetical protein [Opitutales bacterium]